jgi:thiol-disulfide isomerase/thioredoxin
VTRRAWILSLTLAFAMGADARELEANRTLPSCPLTPLDGSEGFDLESYRGRPLLVDFWASWCAACPASFSLLDALEREFRAQGLVVVGINLDEDRESALRFLAQHPVGFRQAADASGSCPLRFGVSGMPATYLVDRDGGIRHEFLGFQAGHVREVRREVQALVESEPEARAEPAPEP